jgi:hypothetical protein
MTDRSQQLETSFLKLFAMAQLYLQYSYDGSSNAALREGSSIWGRSYLQIQSKSFNIMLHGAKCYQILDQLVRSQSLASTVERFPLLRRSRTFSIIILLLWLLSPIGGQFSSRVLPQTDTEIVTNNTIDYFHTGYNYEPEQKCYISRTVELITCGLPLSTLIGASLWSLKSL